MSGICTVLISILLLALAMPAWAQLPTEAAAKALPHLADHEWGQLCKTMADWSGGAYGDFGQWDTNLYLMGDKSRARKAIAKFKPMLVAPSDRNTSREYGYAVPLFYSLLKAEMTAAERAEWQAAMHDWAKMIVGFHQWGPNTRLDDSDVLIAHVTTLKLIDKVLGTEYCKLEPAIVQREQFRKIMALAKGGVLPESSEYNLGTSQLLILGCAAAGWDEYPDVKAWLPELAEQLHWEMTPDFKEAVQWGDVQKPHQLEAHARIPLMLQVIGLGGDRDGKLLHLAAALLQNHKAADLYHNLYRAMWCFDPYTLPAEPRVEHPTGLHVTRDHVIYRTPDTLWHVFAAAPTGLDHQMSQWDARLWHKGEWLSDSLRAYAPWITNSNAGLAFGMEPMQDRGLKSANLTADGARVVLETKGPRYLTGWDHQLGRSAPTPSFIDSWTQTLTLASGKLQRADRFEGRRPERLDRYSAWERAAAETSPALQQLWHTPPGSTPAPIDGGFSWLSRGGTNLKLTSDRSARVERAVYGTNLGTYMEESEAGGWIIRFDHDALPVAEVTSELTWGEPEPAPSPDVPVKGVIRGKQLIIELP